MQKGIKSLVPERMTETAYEKLYEAVNIGRLIGFVGSGISLVYGNLTWSDFVTEISDRLKRAIRQCSPDEEGNPPQFRLPERLGRRMEAELVAVKSEQDESVVVLEFVRQAFRTIDECRGDPPETAYQAAMQAIFASDQVFVSKVLHARLKLAELCNPKLHLPPKEVIGPIRAVALRVGLQLDEESTELALFQLASHIYDTQSLAALAKLAEAGASPATGRGSARSLPTLVDVARKMRDEDDRQHRSTRLPPDRRSLIAVFLASALLSGRTISAQAILPTRRKARNDEPAPPRPLLDPLNELHENLSIRRFFTTNYDFELENLFMFDDIREVQRMPVSARERDLLFTRPDFAKALGGAALTRHRPDGVRVRSDVNDGKHTAPLVEFALGSSDSAVHIFHHHGRVDLPQTMIAADGEYNLMYRAEGLNRQSLDRAYDAMIEGNPVAFVGSGMNEEELLRTLRMRVSNTRSPLDTPVFVFRAAIKPPASLMREQLNLAIKLGAHVVHYGHPRRGTAYSLRRHYMLIDLLAARFDPKNKIRLRSLKRWKEQVEVAKEDSERLAVERLLKRAEDDPQSLREYFRLIWEFDFDRHLMPWLLGGHGARFARELVKRLESGDDKRAEAARELVHDYLASLSIRLNGAALRHELRQINREAKRFYARKARDIEARRVGPAVGSGLHGWARHLSLDTRGTMASADDLAPDWRPQHWHWTALHSAGFGKGGSQPDRREPQTCYAELFAEHAHPLHSVVIGERGTRKGSFLKQLEQDLRAGSRRRWLVVNCCYGQEADSILSLIADFLVPEEGTEGEAAAQMRPRRLRMLNHQQTEGERPLIVLGAVDRLFGIENEPLVAEFEWLLRFLLDASTTIDVVITGSRRCEKFFTDLLERKDSMGGRFSAAQAGTRIYRIKNAGAQDEETAPFVGHGFLSTLHRQSERREEGWLRSDVANARLRMTNLPRSAPMIVGREIESLLTLPPEEQFQSDKGAFERQRQVGRLAQEILKALAFIGLPTEGEVLLSVPGIRRELWRLVSDSKTADFDRTPSERTPSAHDLFARHGPEAREFFLCALNLAMSRNLLNVIEPYGARFPNPIRSAEEAISNRCRFVLHRIVNLVIHDRFDVPVSETVLSDSYNLSLYAAQPDDAPAFKPELTSDIEQLVDHLINCWKDIGIHPALQAPMDALRDSLLADEIYSANALVPDLLRRLKRFARRMQMLDPAVIGGLRAAGGVIRSVFSSVNLLALDLDDPRSRDGNIGVISVHKARIRLLLDYVLEVQGARKEIRSAADRFDNLFSIHVWAPALEGDVNHLPDAKKAKTPHGRQLLVDGTILLDKPTDWVGPAAEVLDKWQDLKAATDHVMGKGGYKIIGTPLYALLTGEQGIPHSANGSGSDVRPFYAEEIVWLLNERAMLSLAQGDLYAAATTFELAFTANEKVEGRTRYYPVRCRLLLNRALLWIERGKIADARRSLTQLRQALGSPSDQLSTGYREGRLIDALAIGYLGLCDQLNGFMKRAEQSYRAAIHKLDQLREQRAIAIFEFHLGSLLSMDPANRETAVSCFARAVAAAEGGRHTDILYRVRVAQAHIDRARGEISAAEARRILSRAVDYGEKLDMHRVAVEALSTRIQLRLDVGDVDEASQDCKRAMAIATQFGMTLRRIWLRVMNGKVYLARNDIANAEFMFERAIEAAERVGYQRAIEVASNNLMSMPRSD